MRFVRTEIRHPPRRRYRYEREDMLLHGCVLGFIVILALGVAIWFVRA